ncbi:MAG: TonB-dependent receptor [Sphingomonadaceae bacterium]
MRDRLRGMLASTILATGWLVPAAPALGQAATASSASAFEDILVTARRTAERLQDVPIAVTAIGQTELERRRIDDIEGLEAIVPNIVITPNRASAGGANIFIRGVGVGDFDRTFNPAVQVLVDEVRSSSSIAGSLVNVVDIERIEILRGPQGTLFGANAIGGVISIIRPRPSDTPGGRVQATLGNFGQVDVRAHVTGPLVEDKLQARISINTLNSNGPFVNEFDGRRRGFNDFLIVTPSLRWTPTERIEFVATYDYSRNRSDWGYLQNRSDSGDLVCIPFLLTTVPFCDDPNRDLTRFNQDGETFLDVETSVFTFRAEAYLGQVQLTSITGWSDIRERKRTDLDGIPAPVFETEQPVDETLVSQEFRATWQARDNLDILGGVYGASSRYKDGANSFLIFSLLGFPPNTVEVVDRQQKTDSFGLFATANWRFADRWALSAGGRWTRETKDFVYRNGFNQVGGGYWPDAPGFNNEAAGTESWSQFTPRIGLEFRPRTDVLLYGSFSQGFKSGGFNGRGNSEDTIGPYDPEKVNSYELGLKSEWLDRRLRLNLALFYADYRDKQEEIINTNPETGATITLVDNAAQVDIWGVEAEWAAIVAPGLTLSGTAGYLNAKYGEFEYAGVDVTDVIDVRNAPRWQFTLNGQYETRINDRFDFDVLVGYRWTDGYTPQLGPSFGRSVFPLWNDPRGFIDSFGILDMSAGLSFDVRNARAELRMFVKNATNTIFYSSFTPVATLWASSGVSQPRTFGGQLTLGF